MEPSILHMETLTTASRSPDIKKEDQVLLNCLYLFEAFGDVESHVSVGDEFPKSFSQQNSYLFVNLVWQEQSFCLQNM